MAVKKNEASSEPVTEAFESEELEPGFYVDAGGARTGPFLTREDAEAFITGQAEPGGVEGNVIEV